MRAVAEVIFDNFYINEEGNFVTEREGRLFRADRTIVNDISFFRQTNSGFTHINLPFGMSYFEDLVVDFFWFVCPNTRGKFQVYAVLSQKDCNYLYYEKVVDANKPVTFSSFERVKKDFDINGVFHRIYVNGWISYRDISDVLDGVVRRFRISSEDNSLLFLDQRIKPQVNGCLGVFESRQKIEGYSGTWTISWVVNDNLLKLCLRVEGKVLFLESRGYHSTFDVCDFKPPSTEKKESEQTEELTKSTDGSKKSTDGLRSPNFLNQYHSILLDEISKAVSKSDVDFRRVEGLALLGMKAEKFYEN